MENEQQQASPFELYSNYFYGKMSEQEKASYERGIAQGKVALPSGAMRLPVFGSGASVSQKEPEVAQSEEAIPTQEADGQVAPAQEPQAAQSKMASPSAQRRYIAAIRGDTSVKDRLTPEEMDRFDSYVRAGELSVPEGFPLRKTEEPGLVERLAESFTGEKRATKETETLKDWGYLPEFEKMSVLERAAVLTAPPEEAVNITKAAFPDLGVRRDSKGNLILKSSITGEEFAVKPGLTGTDLVRAAYRTVLAVPAARVARAGLGALGAAGLAAGLGAGEEAALQALQASKGGEFNVADVALGGAAQVALPVAASAVKSVAQPVASAAGRKLATAAEPLTQAIAERARPIVLAAKMGTATTEPTVARTATTQSSPIDVATRLSRMRAAPSGMARETPPTAIQEPVAPTRAVEPPAPPAVAAAAEMPTPVRAPAAKPLESLDEEQIFERAVSAAPGETAIAKAFEQAPGRGELITLIQQATKGGILGRGDKKAVTALADAMQIDAETLESAGRLGIVDLIQPDHVSSSKAVKELLQVVKTVPGSSFGQAEKEGLEKTAQRFLQIFDELGAEDFTALSERTKNELVKKVDDMAEKADVFYGEARSIIDPRADVQATSTKRFINKALKDRRGEVGQLSGLEQAIYKKITPVKETKMVRGKPVNVVKQPTYAMLDDARKLAGAAARNSGPFKDEDTGLAKALYEVLSRDVERAAKGQSEEAYNLLKQGRAIVRARKSYEEELQAMLGKHLGSEIQPVTQSAISGLSDGKIESFNRLMKMAPKESREGLIMSSISRAFSGSRPGAPASTRMGNYVKWYEKISASNRSKNLLFSNISKESRTRLEDIYRVSKGIVSATSQASRTGLTAGVQKELDDMPANVLKKIYVFAADVTKMAVINMIPSAGARMGIHASLATKQGRSKVINAADELFLSEPFSGILRKQILMQKPTEEEIRRVASSSAFSKFLKAMNKSMSGPERYAAVLKIITPGVSPLDGQAEQQPTTR